MRRIGKILVPLCVLCFAFSFGAAGSEPVTDPLKVLESLALKGRVKSIREENFDAVREENVFVAGRPLSWFGSAVPEISFFPTDGEGETDVEGVALETRFDEAGRPLSFVYDTGDGAGTLTTLYTWDEKGRLLSEERPEEKMRTTYVWDGRGRLTEGVAELAGKKIWRGTMEYDAADNPVKILRYVYDNGQEIPYLTITRTYDDRKRMVREGIRSAEDDIDYMEELLYDTADRLLERRPLDVDGRPSAEGSVFRIRYDSAGNRVEERYESADGKNVYFLHTRICDAGGRIASWEDRYDDGQEVRRGHYEYDAKGHLAKIERDGAWETYRCDDLGNWTERVIHVEEGLEIFTRRTIEYWP